MSVLIYLVFGLIYVSFNTDFNYKTLLSSIIIIIVVAVLAYFSEKKRKKDENNDNLDL